MNILNIFDKFRETIILKEDSTLERQVNYLESLREKHPNNKDIANQLFIAKKGLAGEKEILYQLRKANIGMFVLHDINIEYEDLKAQIDFIIITAWCCYFIECKNLIGNITVNERGDFIREYNLFGNSVKKGMESPYRQVMAQRDVYKKIWLETQGKIKSFFFEKNFEKLHRVLVVTSNGENILNTRYAPKEMKNNIIKSDSLIRKLEYDRDHSDKDLWDNKREMQEWANHFLKLNINKNDDFNINETNTQLIKANKEILKERLIEFRKQRAKERNIPAYYVFTNEELDRILVLNPKTIEELKESKILSDIKLKTHGNEIINIINNTYH